MIRKCSPDEFDIVCEIINDAAAAYQGVIPEDRWHEPYMSRRELQEQIDDGVEFSCYLEEPARILGVMGIQDKAEVALIRHAYVRTGLRRKGIGGALLDHLLGSAGKPVLVGTWAAATWAIDFYEKHGLLLLPPAEKDAVLRRFWKIPGRQIETSVVLATPDWRPDR